MKKIRIIISVAFIFTMCTTATFGLATSAVISKGSTTTATSGSQALSTKPLLGKVESYSNSTGNANQRLTGELWTKGVINKVKRDSTSVSPRESGSMYWANSNKETGTFFVTAVAPSGNHAGKVTGSQY